MPRSELHIEERRAYPFRIALSAVFSLVLAIGLFRWWPPPAEEPVTGIFDTRGQELINAEEILPTRQARRKPPPPAPIPPVVVPNDVPLPDLALELSDALTVTDAGIEDGETDGPETQSTGTTVRPDAGPRPVRFVEPEYTEEARKRNIRAEIVVEVLVNSRGRVDDFRITERFLLKGEDRREQVASVGFGLEDAALAAAKQWMFRPARQDGQIVQSWTTITFSFGL